MSSFRSSATTHFAKAIHGLPLCAPVKSPRAAAGVLSAACLCAPLACKALETTAPTLNDDPVAISVSSEWVASPRDRSSALATSAPQAAMLSSAVRSTVWARSGPASIGMGIETPAGTVANATAGGAGGERALVGNPSLLVGVAVDTSPRSRLVLDMPLSYRTQPALYSEQMGREVRVGLVIKPADPLKTLRAGQLFKVELSGRGQLAVRPRSGGVALSYRTKF